MLNYEFVLRLKAAKKETDSFGIVINLGEYGYAYGYIKLINEKEYEVKAFYRSYSKNEIVNNNEFKNNVEELIKEEQYNKDWFESVEKSIEYVLNEFEVLIEDKPVGDFTDLIDIVDIIDFLEREKLGYLVFKEI